jgi:hypothetical protein
MFSLGLKADLHVCTSWSRDETSRLVDLKIYLPVPLLCDRKLGFTVFRINPVSVSVGLRLHLHLQKSIGLRLHLHLQKSIGLRLHLHLPVSLGL